MLKMNVIVIIAILFSIVLLIPLPVFAVPSWTSGMGEAQTLATCLNFGTEHPDADWCQEFGGDWLDETRAEIEEYKDMVIQNGIPSMSVCNQMYDELKENRAILESLNSIEERSSLYLDTVILDNEYRNYCMLSGGNQGCDIDLVKQDIDSVPEQYHESGHYSSIWNYYKDCKKLFDAEEQRLEQIKAEACTEGTVFHEGQCWAEHLIPKEKTIVEKMEELDLVSQAPDDEKVSVAIYQERLKQSIETACDELDYKIKEGEKSLRIVKQNSQYVSSILGTEEIAAFEEILDEYKKMKKDIGCKSSFGGCLIATATYGSELAPQVQQLREIRDNSLLQTESGTNFMNTFNDLYYSFSPVIADYERENPVFKEMVKVAIIPLITSLSLMEYADSESKVLGIGISLIMLNGMMYVGIPILAIMRFRR